MIELISLTVFFASVLGIAFIVYKKIPVLAELPVWKIPKKTNIFQKIKNKIKVNGFWKNFSKELLLHKILSKSRVLSLKVENKTAFWLKNLRQKTLEKKKTFSDDYWIKLKLKKIRKPRKTKNKNNKKSSK